ncbi:MAG TPA: DMT family transporter, partial [Anaerolineales bacterium]|nr:DMT family transporter [Anaerolineales bacterium]
MNKTLVGILCGLGAASIWGGMYVVSKVVLEIIPPFLLVSLRLILGALTLVIVLWVRGFPKIPRKPLLQVLGVGLVGYGISLSLQFLGTKLSTAANGTLVTSATPAFVLIFAGLLLKERITPLRLIALFLATLGVIAVIDPRSAQLDPDLFLG